MTSVIPLRRPHAAGMDACVNSSLLQFVQTETLIRNCDSSFRAWVRAEGVVTFTDHLNLRIGGSRVISGCTPPVIEHFLPVKIPP